MHLFQRPSHCRLAFRLAFKLLFAILMSGLIFATNCSAELPAPWIPSKPAKIKNYSVINGVNVLNFTSLYAYDETGRVLKIDRINSEGKLVVRLVYKYRRGRFFQLLVYDKDETLDLKLDCYINFIYLNDVIVRMKLYTPSTNALYETYSIGYNASGQLKRIVEYKLDQPQYDLVQEFKYVNGVLVKYIGFYRLTKSKRWETRYLYKNDKLFKEIHFNAVGVVTGVEVYYYN